MEEGAYHSGGPFNIFTPPPNVRFPPIADIATPGHGEEMAEEPQPYLITAYSEWEVVDVEAQCRDDEHAAAKARRYGSLRYINRNFPAVIFSHVVRLNGASPEPVGTWEYRLRGDKAEIGFRWHSGEWTERPDPADKAMLRSWVDGPP